MVNPSAKPRIALLHHDAPETTVTTVYSRRASIHTLHATLTPKPEDVYPHNTLGEMLKEGGLHLPNGFLSASFAESRCEISLRSRTEKSEDGGCIVEAEIRSLRSLGAKDIQGPPGLSESMLRQISGVAAVCDAVMEVRFLRVQEFALADPKVLGVVRDLLCESSISCTLDDLWTVAPEADVWLSGDVERLAETTGSVEGWEVIVVDEDEVGV